MDGFETSVVPGTEGAIHPFFSPDGQWVGFLTTEQLKKVRLDGGTPETLTDVRTPVRATWTEDGTIYIVEEQGGTLSRVSANGGDRTSVEFDGFGVQFVFGDVLPDGSAALFTNESRGISNNYSDVVLLDLETLTTTVLIERGYDARYVPTGHLLFARSGDVLAVPFDVDRREIIGSPVAIATGVAMDSLFAQAQFVVSDDGMLAYVPGGDSSLGKLAWVDRGGTTELLPVEERIYNVLTLSSDDQRVAVHVGDVNDYIWTYDISRNEGRKLSTANPWGPLWKPAADGIVFQVGGSRASSLHVQPMSSGTSARELASVVGHPFSWADGGRVFGIIRLADPEHHFFST